MIQYLKNMAGYSHAQLKDKIFNEVHKLFEKHMKWINNFVPMEEDLPSGKVQKEERSEKKAEGHSRKKSIGQKRAKDKQEQESSKRKVCGRKLVLMGDDGKPLKPCKPTPPSYSNVVSEKVNDLVNEVVIAKLKRYTMELPLIWLENHDEDLYDDDDFNDPGLTDALMKFANTFDINLRGQLR
ncbi:hypothetical protein Tco_0552020 [Tanacetum coccineum]